MKRASPEALHHGLPLLPSPSTHGKRENDNSLSEMRLRRCTQHCNDLSRESPARTAVAAGVASEETECHRVAFDDSFADGRIRPGALELWHRDCRSGWAGAEQRVDDAAEPRVQCNGPAAFGEAMGAISDVQPMRAHVRANRLRPGRDSATHNELRQSRSFAAEPRVQRKLTAVIFLVRDAVVQPRDSRRGHTVELTDRL